VATTAAVLGIALAWLLFRRGADILDLLHARTRGLARVLEEKYGFDIAYNWLAGRVVVGLSDSVLWRALDVRVIDAAVNGAASVTERLAFGLRAAQTGLVRAYALLILGGAVALLSYLAWWRS
jgi:NADH-quinone oxidoreductase subunit L